jgi:hypothetical protein
VGKAAEHTKRINISLPISIAEALEQWAAAEGRATANLAAYLLEQDIRAKFPDSFPPKIIKPKKNAQ